MRQKLVLIFIPFLLTSLCLLAGCTFLHWLFMPKVKGFTPGLSGWNFWLPFVMPFVAVLTWLRRRIKLLSIYGREEIGYQFFFALAMIFPNLIVQYCLDATIDDHLTAIGGPRQTWLLIIGTFAGGALGILFMIAITRINQGNLKTFLAVRMADTDGTNEGV
jgi:hypothetical protein